jgi:hypothetical protein
MSTGDADDNDKLLASLPAVRVPLYKSDRFTYVVLMHYRDDNGTEATSIFTTTRPIEMVYAYNVGSIKHRKGGKARSRDWRVEAFVGPFVKLEPASDFRERWLRSGKELSTRMETGVNLVREARGYMFCGNTESLEARCLASFTAAAEVAATAATVESESNGASPVVEDESALKRARRRTLIK